MAANELPDHGIYVDATFDNLVVRRRETIPIVPDVSTLPAARTGSIVYDLDTDMIYFSDGLQWNVIGAGGGVQSVTSGSGISVDNTDPVNPIINLQNLGGAGTFTSPSSVTIDNFGRITAITPGAGGAIGSSATVMPGPNTPLTPGFPINPDSIYVIESIISGKDTATGDGYTNILRASFKRVGAGPIVTIGEFGTIQENTFEQPVADVPINFFATPHSTLGQSVFAVSGTDVVVEIIPSPTQTVEWFSSTTIVTVS